MVIYRLQLITVARQCLKALNGANLFIKDRHHQYQGYGNGDEKID